MKLFETQSLNLKIDNPGGNWLRDKIRYCREDGYNSFGAPDTLGSITGTWSRNVLIPVNLLATIKGCRGEQDRTRHEDLAWLKKEMETENRLPLYSENRQYCPMVVVWYDGSAWINEGNHRIKAAFALGWEYLPVTLRYFTGGEDKDAILSPSKVKAFDSTALSKGYVPDDSFKGILK